MYIFSKQTTGHSPEQPHSQTSTQSGTQTSTQSGTQCDSMFDDG